MKTYSQSLSSQRVIIYRYGGRAAEIWWATLKSQLTRFEISLLSMPPKFPIKNGSTYNGIDEGQISINDKNSMVL